MIKDKHFAVQSAIGANRSGFEAEGSLPSFHYISELPKMFLEEYLGFPSKI
jgi:hypothetical protein